MTNYCQTPDSAEPCASGAAQHRRTCLRRFGLAGETQLRGPLYTAVCSFLVGWPSWAVRKTSRMHIEPKPGENKARTCCTIPNLGKVEGFEILTALQFDNAV